jgi:hypothetical protein
MYALLIVVCPFVPFLLAIVLSVLHYTDSDWPFGIFKLFIHYNTNHNKLMLIIEKTIGLQNIEQQ